MAAREVQVAGEEYERSAEADGHCPPKRETPIAREEPRVEWLAPPTHTFGRDPQGMPPAGGRGWEAQWGPKALRCPRRVLGAPEIGPPTADVCVIWEDAKRRRERQGVGASGEVQLALFLVGANTVTPTVPRARCGSLKIALAVGSLGVANGRVALTEWPLL